MVKPKLLPQPKRMSLKGGSFSLPAKGSIVLEETDLETGFDLANRLKKELLPKWEILGAAQGARAKPGSVVLRATDKPVENEEGYRLRIKKNGIDIESQTVAGTFYGIQTLLQLVKQYGSRLPLLQITDWPDFKYRGVYVDMTRGRVPKVEEFMRIIEELAKFKINHFEIYVEHTFKFKKHPKIGRGASPYSAEDMLRLDEHARRNFVEFTPSLSSFGHMSKILRIPEYRHMAEDLGVNKYVEGATGDLKRWQRLRGWTLSPAVPKIYDFLKDLHDEFLPNFSSPQVNVCCDETWDLGMGQSYKLCKRLGRGRVYLNHLKKLRKIVMRHGKRMLFWGDIVLKYPKLIKEVPKDVVVLNWGYWVHHDYSTCKKFQKAGLEQWVCPGTSAWNGIFPRIDNACGNISGFAKAGFRTGAKGLLNTDWGDGGHYNFHDYSWHGYIFGAEKSWNVKADERSFDKRFSFLFFDDETGRLGKAVRTLGRASEGAFLQRNSSMMTEVFYAPFCHEVTGWVPAARAKKALKMISEARNVFKEFGKNGTAPKIMKQYIFAADSMEIAANKVLAFHRIKKRPSLMKPLKKKYLAEMRKLRRRFIKLWMSHSHRSEIRITLKRYARAMK